MSLLTSMCLLAVNAGQAQVVEVPFHVAETAIIVESKINGKPASLMFDTGFSGSVVLDDSINIGKPTGKMLLRDFVGQFEAPTVKITSLFLGNKKIESKGMEAVQQSMGNMSLGYNYHTDGIMGFEVIRDNITQINFEKKKFIFYPKNFDINSLKPDNKRTFMAKLLPMGHNSLEIEVNTKKGDSLVLALDTGNSFFATTHKDVLERVGLWSTDRKVKFMKQSGVASGTVDSWTVKMNDMKIYGVPVPESYWDIIDRPSSAAEHDGTVGFGFLKNFNITIDIEKRRVFLENWTGKVSNEPDGEVGLSATYYKPASGILIFDVTPDGPADKAGIKEGDLLLSIDGVDITSGDFRAIDRKLNGPKGTKVKVVVSRRGNLSRYELERTWLFNEALGQ